MSLDTVFWTESARLESFVCPAKSRVGKYTIIYIMYMELHERVLRKNNERAAVGAHFSNLAVHCRNPSIKGKAPEWAWVNAPRTANTIGLDNGRAKPRTLALSKLIIELQCPPCVPGQN